MTDKIIAYKGFDQDLKCIDFQYEIGKEYEMDGVIRCCEHGFHACESPLEVLDHYFLQKDAKIARFCEVEQSGELDREKNSTKVASSKIKIKAELELTDLIKLGIEWIKEKAKTDKEDCCALFDNRFNAKIGSNGNSAKIGSSGDFAQIGSNGNSAQIGSSGDYAQIGSSGNYAQICSSGNSAKIGSSDDSAQIGSSGDYAKIGSSGDSAKIGSSGDSAKIGSSGDFAKINSNGEDSVICCAGVDSIVRAKKGSWITLAEWVYDSNKGRYVPKCVKTEFVDGGRIKENTWYKLENGEFKEVEELL